MKQIQHSRIERAHAGAVKIVKKLFFEIDPFVNLKTLDPFDIMRRRILQSNMPFEEIEAFGKFTHTDFALELRGEKLWLFSIKVVRA